MHKKITKEEEKNKNKKKHTKKLKILRNMKIRKHEQKLPEKN